MVGWTAAGGAVVAVGFGVAELLSANGKFKDFNGRMECGETLKDRGGSSCRLLFDDATSARRLSIVGFAVGGALAATSVLFFLMTPEKRHGESLSFACVPTLAQPGVSCAARF